jgi:hypothetical protein
VKVPPGQGVAPPPGSECCVERRSVHSEDAGCGTEPRNRGTLRWPTRYPPWKARERRQERVEPPVHRRGRRPGHAFDGSPGNLGGLDASALELGTGNPKTKPRPPTKRSSSSGANNGSARTVPPSESQVRQARRDEHREVGASHSTAEAGEPALGDPGEGRGGRVKGTKGGTDEGDTEL